MGTAGQFPSKWSTKFAAQFICDIVALIEEDQKLSESKASRRKSARKKSTSTVPPPASALVQMAEKARLKVRNESILTGNVDTKRKQPKVKTTRDYLIKNTIHNPDFVEVAAEQIEVNLLCPICNHRSLVSVTAKKEAEIANDRIKRSFEQKLADWNFSGKVGPRPRMAKTQSQVLGCVCYLQNCRQHRWNRMF